MGCSVGKCKDVVVAVEGDTIPITNVHVEALEKLDGEVDCFTLGTLGNSEKNTLVWLGVVLIWWGL